MTFGVYLKNPLYQTEIRLRHQHRIWESLTSRGIQSMGVTEDQPQVPDCYKNPSSTHRLGIPIETLESARKIVRVSYDGVQPTAEELERTENRR